MLTLVGCLPEFPIQEARASPEPHFENASMEEAWGVLAHRRSRMMVTIAVLFTTPSTTLPLPGTGQVLKHLSEETLETYPTGSLRRTKLRLGLTQLQK